MFPCAISLLICKNILLVGSFIQRFSANKKNNLEAEFPFLFPPFSTCSTSTEDCNGLYLVFLLLSLTGGKMTSSVRSTCILASFLSKIECSAVKGAGSLVQNFKNVSKK